MKKNSIFLRRAGVKPNHQVKIEDIIEQFGDFDRYEYRPLSEWAELNIFKRIDWSAKRMATLGTMGFLHMSYDRSLRSKVTNLHSLVIALLLRNEAMKAQVNTSIDWEGLVDEIKRL